MEKLTLLYPFQSIYCHCYPQPAEYQKVLFVHSGFIEAKRKKKLATVNRNQICQRGGSRSQVSPRKALLGTSRQQTQLRAVSQIAATPGAKDTVLLPPTQPHSQGEGSGHPTGGSPGAGEQGLAPSWDPSIQQQQKTIHKLVPPVKLHPSTAEGQDLVCAAEVAHAQRPRIPSCAGLVLPQLELRPPCSLRGCDLTFQSP